MRRRAAVVTAALVITTVPVATVPATAVPVRDARWGYAAHPAATRQVPRRSPGVAGPKALPGAQGWGTDTPGGRGGRVISVTTLADGGPGSFRRAALASGRRIVVFRVSGTITLQSAVDIVDPYIPIAGQTAPGGGITLRADPCNVD